MSTPTRQQRIADPFHRICGYGAALIVTAVAATSLLGGQPTGAGFAQWAARTSVQAAADAGAEPATATTTTAAWDEAFARGF